MYYCKVVHRQEPISHKRLAKIYWTETAPLGNFKRNYNPNPSGVFSMRSPVTPFLTICTVNLSTAVLNRVP